MLTKDQIAYGQQKNRNHAWEQAKAERVEYKRLVAKLQNREIGKWVQFDEDMVCIRYKVLCDSANITAW